MAISVTARSSGSSLVALHDLFEVRQEKHLLIVQELCESRGGRPGLSVLTSLLVSVDVKLY